MRQITLSGDTGKSAILLDTPLSRLVDLYNREKVVVITDSNVHEIYGSSLPGYRTCVIEAGEQSKTMDTVCHIYKRLLDLEFDRASVVVGIGGGVVCDVAGFVASTYLRGLRFSFAPTTLLAQVDAGIGGKNGVNLNGYKNLIGTVNQPEFVICDPETLKTLPEEELRNGFAEVIKHGLIGDGALFSYLEDNLEGALSLDKTVINRIVHDSVMVKADIVSRDEMEKSERRKLNFGHTLGHAIERVSPARHGEAVSMGMIMEARLSSLRGMLSKADLDRIKGMLQAVGLPVSFQGRAERIIDGIRKDKKRDDDNIYAILIHGIGMAVMEKVNIKEIEEIIYDMCDF